MLSPYSFAGNSPIRSVDIGGDSIYFVNGSKVFRASIDLILSMTNSSDLIKKAYSSSTTNLYIVQSSDGSASGNNIKDLNAYTQNGVIVAQQPGQQFTDPDGNPLFDDQGNPVMSKGAELPAFATSLVGTKVQIGDRNMAIFINFSQIDQDPIAEVAASILHEAEAHLRKNASHQTYGVGVDEGFNLLRNNSALPGSPAAATRAELIEVQKNPVHKAKAKKLLMEVSSSEGRQKSIKKNNNPVKYTK